MKYGPQTHKHCPHCEGIITVRALVQADARHAVLWTDGYVDSPMLPEQPLAAKCPHCAGAVWLPALAPAAPDVDLALARDHIIFKPGELWDLLEHIDTMEPSQQVYLRMKLWQKSNHRLRHDKNIEVAYDEHELKNMQQLQSLLKPEQVQDRVLIGELLREMGRFEEARAILSVQFHDLVQVVADQILALIDASECRVAKCDTPAQATAPAAEPVQPR